ncbi:hypothetical protein MATL_G00264220 [Megalops atlanticus]|uniref:Uncharacterized protein n=1 Tax=Megalops atlanticus TaxID=7932 RepID=A0A9D3P8G5_MEGAT|nr:hypothetical protein MATL_G00264220 [Megalops atlanticus]
MAINSEGFEEVTLTLVPLSLQEEEVTTEEHVPEFSPKTLRPYPKAGPRKANGQRRRRRVNDILTDTPVKQAYLMVAPGRSGDQKRLPQRVPEGEAKRHTVPGCSWDQGEPPPCESACPAGGSPG